MNEEEREAVEYYQNKEMSFSVDYDKAKFLKALGIEETEEDSFENHKIRFKTLLNLIDKQSKIIDEMAKYISYCFDGDEAMCKDARMRLNNNNYSKCNKNCRECIKEYFEDQIRRMNY